MSNIPRFVAYAAAFEEAVASNDWSRLEPYFREDVVYEIGLPSLGTERCEGRDALFQWFDAVFEGFDRRFASRELELLEGPEARGDAVWIRGSATYRSPGVPDLVLVLEETATFDGDRITRLEDRYTPEMIAEVEAYGAAHGETLGLGVAPAD